MYYLGKESGSIMTAQTLICTFANQVLSLTLAQVIFLSFKFIFT